MLKISDSIRRKYIPNHVWTQLAPLHKDEVRAVIFFIVFFWIDILCIIPIIGDPFIKKYFVAVIIPVIFLNLWAILILIRNYYSTQWEAMYFAAFSGIVCAYCTFLVAVKTLYYNAGVESWVFLVAYLLFYFGFIIYFTNYIFRKYADMKWKFGKKNVLLELLRIIVAFLPSNGYNFYHFYMKDMLFEYHVTSIIYLSMGIMPIYLSILFIHKILFIRANRKHFKFRKPSRKVLKQAEAKGKTIVVQ